jgi:hypothetical protein
MAMPKKHLTANQQWLIEELHRRGAHFTARDAQWHWERGGTYYLDKRNSARKGLVRKFAQANKEALSNEGWE